MPSESAGSACSTVKGGMTCENVTQGRRGSPNSTGLCFAPAGGLTDQQRGDDLIQVVGMAAAGL